jgi:hypothetical protein
VTTYINENNYRNAYNLAGQGLRRAESFTFYDGMIRGLMGERSYNLLEVFEKSMKESGRLKNLKAKALLDFALFRYDDLVKKTNLDKKEQDIAKILNAAGYEITDYDDENLKGKVYARELLERYPEERDKEVMESYFYTAQYFMGLGLCQEFMHFKKQMDEYRIKRSYQGSINLEYDAMKCKIILDKTKKIKK